MIILKLTATELEQLKHWADKTIHGGHFGNNDIILPEESIVLDKINRYDEGYIEIDERDLRIIMIWAENTLGSTLKGMTGEEISLINKLKSVDI